MRDQEYKVVRMHPMLAFALAALIGVAVRLLNEGFRFAKTPDYGGAALAGLAFTVCPFLAALFISQRLQRKWGAPDVVLVIVLMIATFIVPALCVMAGLGHRFGYGAPSLVVPVMLGVGAGGGLKTPTDRWDHDQPALGMVVTTPNTGSTESRDQR